MVLLLILGISVVFVFFFVINPAFAQESVDTSVQTTISKDLENNPVAQDILQKIEKTKRWIEQIEKRASDQAKIEEKKKEVLAILDTRLLELEQKWKQSTFEYRLEEMRKKTNPDYIKNNWQNNTAGIRAYQKIIDSGGTLEEARPAAIQIITRIHGIFLDNLNYTYSKIKEGQDAMKQVLDNGGTGKEAQTAYATAAQMKISDLVAINALNNVKHNMAYYNQQILFEADGQFDYLKSGEFLREYYQDYRVNPTYISANPKDMSWKTIGQTNANTECRVEQVLVYRHHSDDYVCTTEATAEMWEKYNVGKMVQNTPNSYDLSIEQLHEDRINLKIKNAYKKLTSIYSSHLHKITDLDKKYDERYTEIESERQTEEKSTTNDNHLLEIRDRYQALVNVMAQDKEQFIKLVQKSQTKSYQELIHLYEDDKDIKIIWNSDEADYKVIRT